MEGDNISKVEINVHDGGQINFVKDNGSINAVQNNTNEDVINQPKIKSRTQEYFDKWDQNMFLNDFDEWDENAGINVKLSDVYIDEHLPHFVWGSNEKKSYNLKKLLYRYVVERDGNKMLLILGQPGIGKSTLITWIVSNFVSKINDIFVFQFASDLKGVNWQNKSENHDFLSEILSNINLSYSDLNGKVLILDGFDEININYEREDILNNLYRKKKGFSLIITCRENYIPNLNNVSCRYITLQPWDDRQIKSFCDAYAKKANYLMSEKTMANILESKNILGIPLILYMVLALNISIENDDEIVDIYDQIFSLEKGIYDRCIKGISYEEPHRISQVKEQIHLISKNIAIWMFENEPEKPYISHDEYEKICNQVSNIPQNISIHQDFMIGNYFKKVRHCEGIETEKLYFVHRTIYEYFVAEAIFEPVKKAIEEMSNESQEEFERSIAVNLKTGIMHNEICKYFTYKIKTIYDKFEENKKDNFFEWLEKSFEKMLIHGMFFYSKENMSSFDNIIHKEVRCFLNILEVLRTLISISDKKYIMTYVEKEYLENYIKYSIMINNMRKREKIFAKLNLSRLFLTNINLSRMYIENIDLSWGNLTKIRIKGASIFKTSFENSIMIDADLEDANLNDVNFGGADLRKVNFRNTKLVKVNMGNADLRGADLREADIDDIAISGTKLNGTIWCIDSVKSVLSKLEDTNFQYIFVDNGYEKKKVYRSKILTNLLDI